MVRHDQNVFQKLTLNCLRGKRLMLLVESSYAQNRNYFSGSQYLFCKYQDKSSLSKRNALVILTGKNLIPLKNLLT